MALITLYHGTIHDFREIDVTRGKPFKDFGQRFYAAKVYEHARNMALRNRDIELRRLNLRGITREITPWIYTFELDTDISDTLNVKQFVGADKEWVLFVTENRTNNPHRHAYDVVIGPTANDRTNPTIQTYLNEGYGEAGSDRAIRILIELLLPYNLPCQYFFGTERAVKLLVLTGRSAVR